MQLYQRLAVPEMSLFSCFTHYIDGDFIEEGPGHRYVMQIQELFVLLKRFGVCRVVRDHSQQRCFHVPDKRVIDNVEVDEQEIVSHVEVRGVGKGVKPWEHVFIHLISVDSQFQPQIGMKSKTYIHMAVVGKFDSSCHL